MRSTQQPAYRFMLRRLVAARSSRGLTQTEVADRLHIPQSRVSDIERGQRRIDPIELSAFAKLYRKRLDWFVP